MKLVVIVTASRDRLVAQKRPLRRIFAKSSFEEPLSQKIFKCA
jgi:hypothetical protein